LGYKIDSIRNTETVTDARMEIGLEVNTEKTNYMLLSLHQNEGKNYDIKIANRSFENVVQFKYLGTTVSNQNFIQVEIEFGYSLPPFNPEPFAFSPAV
jgi:hypothetical protein